MTRTHAAAAMAALTALLVGCTTPQLTQPQSQGTESEGEQQPTASEHSQATESARPPEPQVVIEGEPPAGAVHIEIAKQQRLHEIRIAPETDPDVKAGRKPHEVFDATVEQSGGGFSYESQVRRGQPVYAPFGKDFTVTLTSATGKSNNGLTVVFVDGVIVDEDPSGKNPPEIHEVPSAYEVKLVWEDAEPGYAVVLYSPERTTPDGVTSQALTRRFFTRNPEWTELVRDGDLAGVAVYPGHTSKKSAKALPEVQPTDDIPVILTP